MVASFLGDDHQVLRFYPSSTALVGGGSLRREAARELLPRGKQPLGEVNQLGRGACLNQLCKKGFIKKKEEAWFEPVGVELADDVFIQDVDGVPTATHRKTFK